MTRRVAGGVQHFDPHGAEVDDLARRQQPIRAARPEMKPFRQQGTPEFAHFARFDTIGVQEACHVGQHRGVGRMHGQGQVIEQVQVHEVVFMPMAQPDRIDPLFRTQALQPRAVSGRVDEDTGAFDVDRVAMGVFSPVGARNETNGAEGLLLHT